MRMRTAKICPPVNKPTRLIGPKSSGPEVGLISGDYCTTIFICFLQKHGDINIFFWSRILFRNMDIKTTKVWKRFKSCLNRFVKTEQNIDCHISGVFIFFNSADEANSVIDKTSSRLYRFKISYCPIRFLGHWQKSGCCHCSQVRCTAFKQCKCNMCSCALLLLGRHEVCLVEGTNLTQPKSEFAAFAYSASHFSTFDGSLANMRGRGDYVLFESEGTSIQVSQIFPVTTVVSVRKENCLKLIRSQCFQVRMVPCGRLRASCISSVAVEDADKNVVVVEAG